MLPLENVVEAGKTRDIPVVVDAASMLPPVRARYMKKKGLLTGDSYDLPTSDMRFPDGAHFRIEVPTCNSPVTFSAILETAEKHDAIINRIDDTFGIMRYTDECILEFLTIAKNYGCEINLSVGPRATYDTSASRATGTPEGNRIGYRLRGMDQVIRATEDVKRATELARAKKYFQKERARQEQKLLILEEAKKMSTKAALANNIEGRGMLKQGYNADVVLLDWDNLSVMSDNLEPRQYPKGMNHVFVNGEKVVEKGKHTCARSGMVLNKV